MLKAALATILNTNVFAVLSSDRNYFETAENLRNFEVVTGGKAPHSETIEILIQRAIAKAERQQKQPD